MEDRQHSNEDVQPRWPWFAGGSLLLASSAAAAISVYLLWLPCRGLMLAGTVWAQGVTKEIPEACLRRMDEGFPLVFFPQDVGMVPSASQMGGLSMVLATASWIVLVLGLRLGWLNAGIALMAAVAPSLVAVVSWAASLFPGAGIDKYFTGWLWVSVDAAAFLVFIVLCTVHRDLSTTTLAGLAFVLWGATAFGAFHLIIDASTMLAFNEFNWDTPPGTGWLTVAVLVISGVASFWFGGRDHASSAMDPRKPDGEFSMPGAH